MAVHGGEAHVRHLIELTQLVHHELAQHPRGYFALSLQPDFMSDSADRLIDGFTRDRALLQRLLHPCTQLGLIVALPHIVRFDDQRHDELCCLKSCEALATGETLAPAANLA